MEITKKLYKKIKTPFVNFCIKHAISANTVTIINHLITLTFCIYFFSRGTYIGNILGLIVMVINVFLDYLDGDIAKSTKTVSEFGVWIDSGFDVIIQNAVMGSIAIGCFKNGLSINWVVLFFISNVGNNLVSFKYNSDFGFDSANGNNFFRDYIDANGYTFLNRFLKNLIDPTASVFGLAFFTFRYITLNGLVLNLMPTAFVLITIIANIRWLIMFSIYAIYKKDNMSLLILRALSALDKEKNEYYALRYNR